MKHAYQIVYHCNKYGWIYSSIAREKKPVNQRPESSQLTKIYVFSFLFVCSLELLFSFSH